MSKVSELSSGQCAAILELGRRGSGAEFDEAVLSELFAMGLIEVRAYDRTVVLTEPGRRLYDGLLARRNAR